MHIEDQLFDISQFLAVLDHFELFSAIFVFFSFHLKVTEFVVVSSSISIKMTSFIVISLM